MSTEMVPVPEGYDQLLAELRERIQAARMRAALAVNSELVLLYWRIGRDILDRQWQERWGARIIDRLALDLRLSFPEMKGFSPRNLKYMRAFAEAWPNEAIVQEVLAQLSWYHNLALLEKLKTPDERDWYARRCIESGWSRNILVHQIEVGLFHRQGKAITNFERTLPSPQSELARDIIKDPYKFDFLSLGKEFEERDLEQALIGHMRSFLLELGAGFAFLGNQFRIEVGNQDFFIDLLMYQLKLRCYVVIELKVGPLQPEHIGKMNFYLSAVDDMLRHPDDNPSIGLILCRGKDKVVAEYSLRDLGKPLGVAEYHFSVALPEHLRGILPSVEQLQNELNSVPLGASNLSDGPRDL